MRKIPLRGLLHGGIGIVFLFSLTSCHFFFPVDSSPQRHLSKSQKEKEEEEEGCPYEVSFVIEGEPESREAKEVDGFIRQYSLLETLKTQNPLTFSALRYRMRQELSSLKKGLEFHGYFDASIRISLTPQQNKPALVCVKVQPKIRYTLKDVWVQEKDCEEKETSQRRNSLFRKARAQALSFLHREDFVDQGAFLKIKARLEKLFKNKGYPFSEVDPPEGLLDREHHTLTVVFSVNLKGKRSVGKAHLSGLHSLDPSYVHNRLLWKEGDLYSQEKLDQTARTLVNTQLFSSVVLTPQEEGGEKSTPIHIEMIEAPPRSLSLGIGYTSSEGMGGRFKWEHRNLKGRGEKLTGDLKINKVDTNARLALEIPDSFRIPMLTLTLWGGGKYENTRAYRGTIYTLSSGMTYPIGKTTLGGGVEYERSRLIRLIPYRESYFSFPMKIQQDHRNDGLNPSQGVRITLETTPYYGRLGYSYTMLRSMISAQSYWSLAEEERGILGFWIRGGTVGRVPERGIPLDKRFYAGGSHSVRGYGYQKLGPIGEDGNPLGGRQLIEGGIEPRLKITDTVGVVIFAEAGRVTTSGSFLAQKEKTLIGYGLGFRYYTSMGPVRLDLAFPSQKRTFAGKQYDSPFQVYVSIGQAF